MVSEEALGMWFLKEALPVLLQNALTIFIKKTACNKTASTGSATQQKHSYRNNPKQTLISMSKSAWQTSPKGRNDASTLVQ